MKRTKLIPVMALAAALSSQSNAESQSDVILLAGQSNAVGPMSDAELLQSVPSGWLWVRGDKQWHVLRPQEGEFEDGHFGPEMGIADATPNPYIFKFAIGSTSLNKDWRPAEETGLLAEMMQILPDALKDIGGRPSCFVFVQGESDAETHEMAARYPLLLDQLVARVRSAFPGIPIILSVDELHPWIRKNTSIIEAQKGLADKDDHIQFVSFRDLPKADQTHLTAAGTLEQGRRLGKACKQSEAKRKS